MILEPRRRTMPGGRKPRASGDDPVTADTSKVARE